jgi:hypothetical protein
MIKTVIHLNHGQVPRASVLHAHIIAAWNYHRLNFQMSRELLPMTNLVSVNLIIVQIASFVERLF